MVWLRPVPCAVGVAEARSADFDPSDGNHMERHIALMLGLLTLAGGVVLVAQSPDTRPAVPSGPAAGTARPSPAFGGTQLRQREHRE